MSWIVHECVSVSVRARVRMYACVLQLLSWRMTEHSLICIYVRVSEHKEKSTKRGVTYTYIYTYIEQMEK